MNIAVKISDVWRTIPQKWYDAMQGPKPSVIHGIVDWHTSNGCSYSPDYPMGTVIWPACLLHDYHYSGDSELGGKWASRREADNLLRKNISIVLGLQGVNWVKRQFLATTYWYAVRRLGWTAFNYAKEEYVTSDILSTARERTGLFRDTR